MSHGLFRMTKKMTRLLEKKKWEKYSKHMEKMSKKGKLKPITLEQAKCEGLIQYGDNK